MILGDRSLDELSLNDILVLVESRIPEGPHLEYKREPYGCRPQDRGEMLRDIVALANADGRYLIIGIDEDRAGRASSIVPVDNPQAVVQSMRQTCLDCISDRIEGLEIEAFETDPGEGLVVVRVPKSEHRPHMTTLYHRTEFVRRYGTDKRAMTIGEIRSQVFENPHFRRLVELELQAAGKGAENPLEREVSGPPYARLLTKRAVEQFIQRYLVSSVTAQTLFIVSPFISDLSGSTYTLKDVLDKVNSDRTRLYVITQPPREDYQREAVAILEQCQYAEVRLNPDVHAKLYVCWSRDGSESFALFGSGNLTLGGVRDNIELGIMVFPRGYGRTLVNELYQWGNSLRFMSRRSRPALTTGRR